jgi:hypothetical protein
MEGNRPFLSPFPSAGLEYPLSQQLKRRPRKESDSQEASGKEEDYCGTFPTGRCRPGLRNPPLPVSAPTRLVAAGRGPELGRPSAGLMPEASPPTYRVSVRRFRTRVSIDADIRGAVLRWGIITGSPKGVKLGKSRAQGQWEWRSAPIDDRVGGVRLVVAGFSLRLVRRAREVRAEASASRARRTNRRLKPATTNRTTSTGLCIRPLAQEITDCDCERMPLPFIIGE